jgi:membrane associated rhomboid family serine protease
MNIIIFIAMGGGRGDMNTLLQWGASVAPSTTSGEWWRLFTAAFVHVGFFQLLFELIGFLQPGLLLERLVGSIAFAAVYVGSAAIATAIGLLDHPLSVSTGAAGGVLGVYGMLTAVLLRGVLKRSPVSVPFWAVRSLAPAVGVYLLYTLWTGDLRQPSGLIPLGTGFVFGMALTRDIAERRPRTARLIATTAATVVIVAAIAVPLRGLVDARSEITSVLALEDQTTKLYDAAVEQLKLGAVKPEGVAQTIDRSIEPELRKAQARLADVGPVAREQQPILDAARRYTALRVDSWQARARALHKSNLRMLREADEKERAALAALDRLKSQATQ